MAQLLLDFGAVWFAIPDGSDSAAARFYERHYSAVKSLGSRNGSDLILGPGEKMLLVTPCRRAMFGWRKFIDDSGQTGINCAVFRNEGAGLSSDLIRAADEMADQRWPSERHYTYVDPSKVANSNAGRCFWHAGWRYVRDADGRRSLTKSRKLFIMERLP